MVCVRRKVARMWRKEVLGLSYMGFSSELANEHCVLKYIKIMDSRNRVWRSKIASFPQLFC